MTKKIVVIGGGITGLSAANRLVELSKETNIDIEIILLEQSGRIGGVISTLEKNGFLIEEGPDSFITTKPWALNLSNRLGLNSNLIQTNDNFRRTYILLNNKLIPVPEGFLMLAPARLTPFLTSKLFSWSGKLRILADLIIPKSYVPDESLASFVKRRLGKEALERVAQPMISGVYTADPEKLSLRATMPQFIEMEERFGSVIRAMLKGYLKNNKEITHDSGARYSQFVSYKNGMKTMLNALKANIPDESLKFNQKVIKVEQEEDCWKIITDKEEFISSAVILAAPSHVAANLISELNPSLAGDLAKIEYASSAVVISVYKREAISHDLDGFGFVVPMIEKNDLIACSFNSIKFEGRAPKGYVILRSFLGGAMNPGLYNLEDQDIINRTENVLAETLGIRSAPEFVSIKRHLNSMPQYHIGHLDLVSKISAQTAKLPGLELAGNAYYGVGIPDCVRSGETAAENILKYLDQT